MTAKLEYLSFDPSRCRFPSPRVSVLPQPGRHAFRWQGHVAVAALLDSTSARLYTRGRYAMEHAYRLCGVGPHAPLLAPAYHCRTMLDPAIQLGAEVLLYPLRPDLQPDFARLQQLLRTSPQRPVALLATHFFGFAQPLAQLRALCDEHAIALIEDGSHTLFLPNMPGSLGLTGRYCVASPYKFFPIEDGGVLWANQGAPMPPPPHRPGSMAQLKGVARVLQRLSQTPLDLPACPTIPQTDAASELTADVIGEHHRQHSGSPSEQYDASAENTGCLAVSRILMQRTDIDRIVWRRRKNYLAWSQAVAPLAHCAALQPDLEDGCVPYMFPLRIEQPDSHFHLLKRQGMPVWRWDDMAVSTCDVAMDYRTHLLHLPCHQELSEAEMEWMAQVLTSVMTKARGHIFE